MAAELPELGVLTMKVGQDHRTRRLFLLPVAKELLTGIFDEYFWPDAYILSEVAKQLNVPPLSLAFKEIKFKLTVEALEKGGRNESH